MTDEISRATLHQEVSDELRASEIRYRRLFESARDGILILDATSCKITDANPFMVELLGYSRDEFLGKELWEIGLLKDEEASKAAFEELLEEGYIRYEGLPLETKAGARRELEFISNIYVEGADQVIQCNIRDITKRKQAEAALQESEEWLRAIFEASRDGILVEDNGVIVYVNKSYVRMLGYDAPKELLGKHISGILPPDEAERLTGYGNARLRGETPPTVYEFKGKRKDGSLINIEGAVSTTTIAGKIYIITSLRDITARKKAQQDLIANEIAKRRLAERQTAILNALPSHICLLDGDGNILDVNATWRRFALENNYCGNNFGIGSNYLEVCESASGEGAGDAQHIADGIRDVISGKSNHFEFEYPCHAPEEKRWFRLTVTSLQEDPSRGVVVMHVNITERKLSEEARIQAEAKYRSIVESLPAIIYLAQPDPPYAPIYVSPNVADFGYPPEDWFSREDMWISLLHKDDRERVLRATEAAMSQGLDTELEYRIVGREGAIHWVQDKGRFILDEHGNRIGWQGVMLDITKTKELEEQLRQSQKLESVGRLAGGIAHDFNNMLTAINGYSDLTLRRLKDDDPLRRNIEEIKKAGVRSAALTHQLLAFSRQQILQPKVLFINQIITETSKMLERLIGEDVQLSLVLHPKAGPVKVDPGQLSQIIINLAVNARDAMPQGGKLTIETANIFLDPNYTSQRAGVIPGAYVMMAVCDTGTGMSAETQEHIFEPFFTTKEVGKGTGLGLATVYGIVKQSGGNINVYSEEGIGTTFKVYLPRVVDQSEVKEAKPSSDELPEGTETILLVEDEDMVRSLTRQILELCGYTVMEARNGVEALSICEKHDCHIDLLMTDVVMPQMGGRELADKFAAIYPQMRILFTSGYTDEAIVHHNILNRKVAFIQKPFTPQAVARKVREVLDAAPAAPSPVGESPA